MADELRAKFELDFAVGSSEPLTAVREILERIDQSLEKLRQATNPFAELTEPVARATRATTAFNETLARTTSATEAAAGGNAALAESLTATGEAATEAATGLGRMGTEAEASAAQVSSAMERAQAAYRAAAEVAKMPSVPSSPAGGNYFDRVRGAGQHFMQSGEHAMHSAMGAAMTGMAFVAPVHAAAEYDNDLTHIGITLGVPTAQNPDFARDLGRRIDAIARATGQRSTDLVGAASFLSMEGFKLPQIMSMVPAVAKISTGYNADPEAVAKTAFTLNHSMHISDQDMPRALAMVARVGKESALPMEKLASLFPEVAAQGSFLGVTGMQGVRDMAAMTAVIRKSVGSEGQATTNLRAMMQTLTTQHGRQRFSKVLGVDVEKVMNNAVDQGLDPLEAILEKIRRTGDMRTQAHYISQLFNNEQDQAGVAAILKNLPEYFRIRGRIGNTSSKMIDEDFDAGLKSTLIRLHAFEDALGQVERRIGTAFVPIMNIGTKALHGLANGFDWLDKHIPGATTGVLAAVGTFLLLSTTVGAIGAIAIPFTAAFGLVAAVLGTTTLAAAGVVAGVAAVGAGVVAAGIVIYKNWGTIKGYFTAFGAWVTGWASLIGSAISHAFEGVFSKPLATLHAVDQWFDHSSIGQAMDKWLAHPAVPAAVPAAPGAQAGEAGGGQFGLHVSHDPGVQVRQTSGPRGLVSISPDRGRMVAQP